MRCATPTIIYAFTGTGITRGTYPSLTVGPEGATCTTAQYVVMTQPEYVQATTSPFNLTLVEAGAISSAILLVWATGFAIRMAVKAMNSASDPPGYD